MCNVQWNRILHNRATGLDHQPGNVPYSCFKSNARPNRIIDVKGCAAELGQSAFPSLRATERQPACSPHPMQGKSTSTLLLAGAPDEDY